jgi:hypothetical protein
MALPAASNFRPARMAFASTRAMLARIELAARDPENTSTAPRGVASALMAREFPGLPVVWTFVDSSARAFVLDAEVWRSPRLRFAPLDEAFERAVGAEVTEVTTLRIVGDPRTLDAVAIEAVTRWQRHVERRNPASATAKFDELLARHRALHDRAVPALRASFDHNIDVWRWVLRLAPGASFELQAAALLRDLEQLVNAPDLRVEEYVPDHTRLKGAHATRSAEMAWGLCAPILGRGMAERVAKLVQQHGRCDESEELLVLRDAGALSFFSLGSPYFLARYGAVQTARKVAYVLGHMRAGARRRLGEGIRMEAEIAALVWAASARGGAAPPLGRTSGDVRA